MLKRMSAPTLTSQRALSILAVADLVAWQASLGRDPKELLEGTGIDQADLANHDAVISPLQEQAFFRRWLTLDQRPDLGLAVGAHYRLADFGHLGLIVPHAATRRQAIELFIRFINLSYTHFQPELDTQAGVLTLKGGEQLGDLRRFYMDRDVAFAVHVARQFFKTDGAEPLLRVSFDYALPADQAARYAKALGLPVSFGQTLTQVHFNTRHLDEPMPDANALLVRMLQPQCEEREARMVSSATTTWTQRIQDAFDQHTGPGPWPDARALAGKLRCSERTLRRHLAAESTPFQLMSDQARSRRAKQLLTRTQAPLDEIAQALGYSESASFIRAYKRWFGRPPGQDRH